MKCESDLCSLLASEVNWQLTGPLLSCGTTENRDGTVVRVLVSHQCGLFGAIYTLVFLAAAFSGVTQRPSQGKEGGGVGGCRCTTLKMAARENEDAWVEFAVGSKLAS